MRKTWGSRQVLRAGLALIVAALAGPTLAQVVYQPFAPTAPTPYGYPVPSGFLQPNEVLGTSPSFLISPNPYLPTVAVVQRCQYPDGWNVTDLSRDVNGIPNGIEHTCPVTAPLRGRVRARY